MEASLLEPAPVPTTKVPQAALPSVPARPQPAQVRGATLRQPCSVGMGAGAGAGMMLQRGLASAPKAACLLGRNALLSPLP
jgi:hypothetical protein